MGHILYKVVRRCNGKLVSLTAQGKYAVEYSTEEFAEAPIGGLLTFADQKNAFTCKASDTEIWECEGQQQVKLPLWRVSWLGALQGAEDIVEKVWSPKGNSLSGLPYLLEWPQGTLAFKRVKLLRKVCPKNPSLAQGPTLSDPK